MQGACTIYRRTLLKWSTDPWESSSSTTTHLPILDSFRAQGLFLLGSILKGGPHWSDFCDSVRADGQLWLQVAASHQGILSKASRIKGWSGGAGSTNCSWEGALVRSTRRTRLLPGACLGEGGAGVWEMWACALLLLLRTPNWKAFASRLASVSH